MGQGTEWKPSLHNLTTAYAMFMRYGDFSNYVPGQESPMWLKSGLPFGVLDVPYDNPQEGRTKAAVAGELFNLANLEQYPDGPLIRMHSACIFSEIGDYESLDRVLNRDANGDKLLSQIANITAYASPSLECDCKAQREAAQALIAQKGGIYFDLMDQEGRGAGLGHKREAYELHTKEGLDTAEAYERLGIEFDTREYGHVARFLLYFVIKKVRLLSNNPRKIAALEAYGIEVIPVRLVVGVTGENIEYLRTKRDKGGHEFPDDDLLESLVEN